MPIIKELYRMHIQKFPDGKSRVSLVIWADLSNLSEVRLTSQALWKKDKKLDFTSWEIKEKLAKIKTKFQQLSLSH